MKSVIQKKELDKKINYCKQKTKSRFALCHF